ncbi:hypothetical protein DVH24_004888 [Malus domestica]|uniref:Uncharacterized protein n=1 Tax=Malus domestica TaxID=3750 RepID=A0A498IFN7_MALDO|nr:hypothetical protein DVH24_004888 [Malus domestica]
MMSDPLEVLKQSHDDVVKAQNGQYRATVVEWAWDVEDHRVDLVSLICIFPSLPSTRLSGNSHENFPVGHPSWDCSRANSLNFGVPTEPEASELQKNLVLGRDENIHIRLTGSTPLGDVGCYNPPPRGSTSSSAHFWPGIWKLKKLLKSRVSLETQCATASGHVANALRAEKPNHGATANGLNPEPTI